MSRPVFALALALAALAALAACTPRSAEQEPPVPARPDARPDTPDARLAAPDSAPADAAPDPAPDSTPDSTPDAARPAGPSPVIRVATFNAALNRGEEGALRAELEGDSAQARAVAEIVQRVAPDVLVLQEFDHDPAALEVFRRRYLAVAQNGAPPIEYPYVISPPSNTGAPSGLDLDRDGRVEGPGDAWGFGQFRGQYAFSILSRHPIDEAAMRSFRLLRWSAMPGARVPVDPESGAAWYAPEIWAALRLSSKNHVDVPISVGGKPWHLLVAHPTPPVFDGPEDRNGRRNADEIRLWADYVDPARSGWIVDDSGRMGGLAAGVPFVIAGDLNADPVDGDSADGAIEQLLGHARVHPAVAKGAQVPRSEGGRLAGREPGHRGDAAHDTAGWGLRVDYVLPSAEIEVVASSVFWPGAGDALARLVGRVGERDVSSDHRLVWVDLRLP